MRSGAFVALVLVIGSATLAQAQGRGALLCAEDVFTKLPGSSQVEDGLEQAKARRKFSLVMNRDLLNLITAGQTDYYECQDARPRLNEGTPKDTIKCQNGIYFFTLDLKNLRFVRAALNPEQREDVSVSFGSCRPI